MGIESIKHGGYIIPKAALALALTGVSFFTGSQLQEEIAAIQTSPVSSAQLNTDFKTQGFTSITDLLFSNEETRNKAFGRDTKHYTATEKAQHQARKSTQAAKKGLVRIATPIGNSPTGPLG
ncbi:MAG: hypothetical protein M3N08_06895 [Pseudomonadota bacterium]|nr:hypothetical protein [Pseudomonadota bacterium]